MLSVDQLLRDAKTESGLDDYGPADFAEGLRILVKSLNEEAGLSPANEARAREHLLRALCNRLRMQRDLARHPDILDEEILPPVFITSMPRTGSTKLHRMLAASGDFNFMTYWQVFNFARFDFDPMAGTDPRIAVAERHLDWVRARSPLFMEAHPMYADEAEEELHLLDAGFNSLYNHASFFKVPSYVEWVIGLDPTQAFLGLRRGLQYLQWQHYRGSRRRWVLKTPALLGTEATFASVFNGTDFIVTHRRPENILASVCALFCGVLGVHNDGDFTAIAGPLLMHSFGETVSNHLRWRETYPADKVLDARFGDVVANEFELLPRIYDFLGMSFTDAARRNIQAWLDKDAARRQASRQFDLATYGLDADRVNERFAGYIRRYADFL